MHKLASFTTNIKKGETQETSILDPRITTAKANEITRKISKFLMQYANFGVTVLNFAKNVADSKF